jgi:hypothetical protein
MQAARLAGFIDSVVEAQCEDKLEEAAKKLEKQMKDSILGNKCELAPNGDFTTELKGSSVPLVDTKQMVNGIRYKMYGRGEFNLPKEKTNRFRAAFVGILRDSGITYPSSHIGVWRPVSLFLLAKNQVRGYTVTLPGNKVQKKVPARDFRKAVRDSFKEEYMELMKSGASAGFMRLVR